MPKDEQHEIVKKEREVEIFQRQSLFEWARDATYSDMPGFIQAFDVKDLPRDVQFTDEATLNLFGAGANTFFNKILMSLKMHFLYVKLTGHLWNNFDDYRKVLLHLAH